MDVRLRTYVREDQGCPDLVYISLYIISIEYLSLWLLITRYVYDPACSNISSTRSTSH